jgi:hypothetical protein
VEVEVDGKQRRRRRLTLEELNELGVSTDIPTAGRAFGFSREAAYRLAQSGDFPCAVLKVGSRYVVPVADLRRALGIDDQGRAVAAG